MDNNKEITNYFQLGKMYAYSKSIEEIVKYENTLLSEDMDAYCSFCSGVISAQESMAKNHKDNFIAQIIKQGVIKGTKNYVGDGDIYDGVNSTNAPDTEATLMKI